MNQEHEPQEVTPENQATNRRPALIALALIAVLVVTTFLLGNNTNTKQSLFTVGTAANAAKISSDSALGMPCYVGDDKELLESAGCQPIEYEYVANNDISNVPGNGHVYQLTPDGTVENRVAQLAKLFNLPNKAVQPEWSTSEYPNYIIGSQDGTAPSVNLMWGTGDWSYYNPQATGPISMGCAQPGSPDGSASDKSATECQEPELGPDNRPTNAEAINKMIAIAKQLGQKIDTSTITIERYDAYMVSGYGEIEIPGVSVPSTLTVSWSRDGSLVSSNGSFIRAIDKGVFNTVSALVAVKRISDYRWFGSPATGFGMGAPVSIMASDAIAKSGGSVSTTSSTPSGSSSPGQGTIEPMPIATSGPVEPKPTLVPTEVKKVTVTITSASVELLRVWDANGKAWLVPGYKFTSNFGEYFIISLPEGVISLPEAGVMPMARFAD